MTHKVQVLLQVTKTQLLEDLICIQMDKNSYISRHWAYVGPLNSIDKNFVLLHIPGNIYNKFLISFGTIWVLLTLQTSRREEEFYVHDNRHITTFCMGSKKFLISRFFQDWQLMTAIWPFIESAIITIHALNL